MAQGKSREQWHSRSAFLFAAIGSAIGLGNAWRFPGQVFQNGGGAFLIPYIIAICAFGIPILIMEISIGKKYQLGAPSALAAANKRFEWLGWAGVITCFIIVSYYSVIVAWIFDYLFYSFTMPWGADPAGFFYKLCIAEIGIAGRIERFFHSCFDWTCSDMADCDAQLEKGHKISWENCKMDGHCSLSDSYCDVRAGTYDARRCGRNTVLSDS